MTRLRSLARAAADAGLADLGRLLTYKARWHGCELVITDRDVNAAVNLARWPDRHRDHPPLVAAA
jgi:transposase